MRRLLAVILVLAGVLAAAGWRWLDQPLRLREPLLDLSIDAGSSVRGVAQDVVAAGVDTSPYLLYWWFRLSGQARQIQAGHYELQAGISPRSLLLKIVRGEQARRSITLVEGLTFRQWRGLLAQAPDLKPDSQSLSDEAIMARLGRPKLAPEGRFYPDTYAYNKGGSDLALLARAMRAMDQQLDAAWRQRDQDLPLQSPDQLLILASIVEKETSRASERPLVAAVFINRLRLGMLLQTDPTVIYGLGANFDGNLRRRHLLADTPWNTYTRAGLPPTPIAMPGKEALWAAAHPANSQALYFVARGDGSSEFSDSLAAHNRAVAKYQLKR